ncbi:MAG TPA: hypothetical protein VIG25_25355 [Pyrinomonadaceae bacterium]
MRQAIPPVLLSILISLVLQAAANAQTNKPRAPQDGESTVIFSVNKYEEAPTIQIEPIVIIRSGRYIAPPVDAEPAVTKKFTDTYFRPGRRYRVVFGGGDAGTLTVQKEIEPGCVGLTAEVVAQTTARLGGQVQALAVSSDNIGRGESSRRAPTEDERAEALDVARSVYAQRRVGVALIKKINTVNLTATDLERDGKFELIGSFEIRGANYVAYNLFIIFERTAAGKYKAAWTWYKKGAEIDFESRSLVDAVDLDGDGTAEVIAGGSYYESNDYVIYKRQAGTWRPIYRGGGGGC